MSKLNAEPAKVAYILPFYDERTDTHLFYNYELLRSLSSRREVEIFAVIEKGSDEESVNLGVPFKIQSRRQGFARLFELYRILKRLRKSGYDNFYVHYSYYGALASWLVTRFSGGRIFYWNRGMPWLFRRSFFEEMTFRFILKRVILVTGPESIALEYKKRYNVKRYEILSNWIDAKRFYPREEKTATKSWFGISGETRVILFVHHLSERKGADLVPAIASHFADLNVAFFVVGDGPYRARLKLEAEDSRVPIKIIGAVPNEDIVTYFQAADVFIMPSREEGSPHVILDSMAAGTPFVASDIGGVREIIAPGFEEFLCPPEDVACFEKKIRKLLSDRELYEKLRLEGLGFVKKFDKEKGVSDFIALFR